MTNAELIARLGSRPSWLQGGDEEDANLGGAYLRGTDLRGADLQGADLRGAYLRGANLQNAYLYGADLLGANLSRANLEGAVLQEANLYGAYFGNADLQRANLRGANLRDTYLRGADLRGAILPTGETWEVYLAETVPALLTAGGKELAEVARAWDCHSWVIFPIAVAFGVRGTSEVPAEHRAAARQFDLFFDARLIPRPAAVA